MFLTKEEERIYDGQSGWAQQTSMKILVKLGELFNANRLIPISSAHVSGVSYKTLGDAPTEFLKAMANDGAKARTRSTLNPQSFDSEYLIRKIEANLRNKQLNILKQFEKMGFSQSLTCTPYYLKAPRKGAHIAWAESSAVVYANSLLGAHTNREGGPSALAAAIIGKTPDHGVHQPEHRQPNVAVTVDTQLRSETDYGALGIYLGKVLRDRIPIIQGIENASESCLKQLGAALGTTGMVDMFCRSSQGRGMKLKGTETIGIEAEDVSRTIEGLSTATTYNPDLVFIGCPHCSVREVEHIARLVEGKKVKKGTEFWVCTSRYVKETAENNVSKIKRSGGHVLADVCTVVSWTEAFGIETIMTNSAKTAYYAPTLNKANTILAPLQECVRTAFIG